MNGGTINCSSPVAVTPFSRTACWGSASCDPDDGSGHPEARRQRISSVGPPSARRPIRLQPRAMEALQVVGADHAAQSLGAEWIARLELREEGRQVQAVERLAGVTA